MRDDKEEGKVHDLIVERPHHPGEVPQGTVVGAHRYKLPHDLITHFRRPDTLEHPLYVVTPVFNGRRFRTRWKSYQDFKLHMAQTGAILCTVELAYGQRAFAVTNANNPLHVQLRTSNELWFKENMINLGMQAILQYDQNARYLAWIDCDLAFQRPDIANETLHTLQHHPICQMWSQAVDLTPGYEILQSHRGFAYCYQWPDKVPPKSEDPYYYGKGAPGKTIFWHPGYAWACRREAWDAFGGLIDFAVLGSADSHMANGFIGEIESSINEGLHPRYKEMLRIWGDRCDRAIKRNIGCVPGLVSHYWHGPKVSRRYVSRWKILIEEGFNPDVDLFRDAHGLWQLSDRNYKLRDRIMAYFQQRNEDDIHEPDDD